MTNETKHFIELSDVTAVRLACRACEAELHVKLTELPQPNTLSICPNCRRPWASISHNQFTSHNYEKEFTEFMGQFLGIKKLMSDDRLGFRLTLEVNDGK
jgi:hypothetical protein